MRAFCSSARTCRGLCAQLCLFSIGGEVIGVEINRLIESNQRFVISSQTDKDLCFLPVVVVSIGVEHNGLLDGF
jgi:hypothetical protein